MDLSRPDKSIELSPFQQSILSCKAFDLAIASDFDLWYKLPARHMLERIYSTLPQIKIKDSGAQLDSSSASVVIVE